MDDEIQAELIRSQCMTGDCEGDHYGADEILVSMLTELGFTETVAAYRKVGKWYA